MVDQLQRLAKPCSNCRGRHLPCYQTLDDGPSCIRCERKGLDCDIERRAGERLRNVSAELKQQIDRLNEVLERIQRSQHIQHVDQEESVQDIIGALTHLCFSQEGLASGPRGALLSNELVQEASNLLSTPDRSHIQLQEEAGFMCARPSTMTIEDLTRALPSYAITRQLMDTFVQGSPCSASFAIESCLFWPDWPDEVDVMYQSGLHTADPLLLAELFAVLALGQRGSSACAPELRPVHEQSIELYLECAQRALELGNYREIPSTRSLRTLHLLFTSNVLWATQLSRFARGHGHLIVALSLAFDLGFHREEAYWADKETRKEQHLRRAAVSAICRADWTYSQSYGRQAFADLDTFRAEPPADIEDAYLPERLRKSPWRPGRASLLSVRVRDRTARLQQRVSLALTKHESCSEAQLRSLADELQRIERNEVPDRWALNTDPVTGHPTWRVPFSELTIEEINCALYVRPKLCKIGLALHRPFILGGQETSRDWLWHRKEVAHYAREWLVFVIAANVKLQGEFVTIMCSGWDAVVGLSLVICLYPDDIDMISARSDLLSVLAQWRVRSLNDMPPAFVKLCRLLAYLLQRPKAVRNLEQSHKKTKSNHVSRAYKVENAPTPASDGVIATASAHGQQMFDFTSPLHPSTLAWYSGEDDLVHKLSNVFDTTSRSMQPSRSRSSSISMPSGLRSGHDPMIFAETTFSPPAQLSEV